jgi:hypothetical protein
MYAGEELRVSHSVAAEKSSVEENSEGDPASRRRRRKGKSQI